MPTLALILARAGSKGVPHKNRAMVAGRPCIAWTIDAALAAARVDHIAVSTDDPAIAEIAADMGVLPLARPPALATDTARVDDAARHAVLAFERDLVANRVRPSPACGGGVARGSASVTEGGNKRPFAFGPSAPPEAITRVVILYANVPIRPAGLIDRALDLLESTNADSVQSYQPVGKHHPWWTARVDTDSGHVTPWEGDVLNHGVFRRQDLPPAFIPDGAVLVVTRRALMLEIPGVPDGPHAFFGRDRRGIINPEGSVVDIDTPLDLVVADAKLRAHAPR